MRRNVMSSASRNIVNALSASNIYKVISANRIASKGGRGLNSESLKALNNYSLLAATYGEAEKEVCNSMNIGELGNPAKWHRLIEIKSPEDDKFVIKTLQNIRFAQIHLPKLLNLIQQDLVEEIKDESDDLPNYLKDKELLNVTVIEEAGIFSSPKRLSNVLDSIDTFYNVISSINKLPNNDLMVLAIDSGGDKSFDFLGTEQTINGIKDLILSIWDMKVFHRNNQAGADIYLISKSLPIIEEIKKLKDAGELDHDTAEKLIDDTVKAATKLIESGITIPEINDQASPDPRKLMKPEAKLLVSDEPVAVDEETNANQEANELSTENNVVDMVSDSNELSTESEVVDTISDSNELSTENNVVDTVSDSKELSIEKNVIDNISDSDELSFESNVVDTVSDLKKLSIEKNVIDNISDSDELSAENNVVDTVSDSGELSGENNVDDKINDLDEFGEEEQKKISQLLGFDNPNNLHRI